LLYLIILLLLSPQPSHIYESQDIMFDMIKPYHQKISMNSENYLNASSDDLKNIKTTLERFRQGSLSSDLDDIYVTVIAFLTGSAFVLFGLYATRKNELTQKMHNLYALSILSLTIPSTIILIEFIVISTIAIDPLHDIPIILLGFLLLIPIGTLYVLVASTLKKKAVN
jgi:hypothetical protein